MSAMNISVVTDAPVAIVTIDRPEVRHGLATIESGETLTGAQRFAAGAGRHGRA
jgi:hypothetical protein